MIELPELGDYSEIDLKRAIELAPPVERYLQLIQRDAKNPSDELRLKRHRAWLRASLASLLGKAPPEDICYFWSMATDKIVSDLWQSLWGSKEPRVALLGLGKLGSCELNLSSDMDLVVVAADTTSELLAEAKRALQVFAMTLSDSTEFGFAYRVDLTLRPGGKASNLLPTYSEFEYHYGYMIEPWERLAYIRARFIAGDSSLADEVLSFAKSFSFRRHIDVTMLDELYGLRSKIASEMRPLRTDEVHLKLSPGGIRDIELFVHSLQAIHGGKHPALKTYSTTKALQALSSLGLLNPADQASLQNTYWELRRFENVLHSLTDQQLYLLNLKSPPTPLTQHEAQLLKQQMKGAEAIISRLSGPVQKDFAGAVQRDNPELWLKGLGFSDQTIQEVWPQLVQSNAHSKNQARDESARLAFLNLFVSKVAEIKRDQDLALALLLDFIRSTRAKASFFSLLVREPRLTEELAWLFSISPYLGGILSSRPELIDSFLFSQQAEKTEDTQAQLEALADRRMMVEIRSAQKFLNQPDLKTLGKEISSCADHIARELLDLLAQEYGTNEIEILALGKWGGCELGLRSDLDFIFLLKDQFTEKEQKVAKRFISRITEPHRGGAIYSVDMRLRPSGQAGPLLVSKADLLQYLREKAEPWERQAYLRSRPINSLSGHTSLVPHAFAEAGARRGLSSEDLLQLRDIRSKLIVSVDMSDTSVDLKLASGGLADIEFAAQIALLNQATYSADPSLSGMIDALVRLDAKWKDMSTDVLAGYTFLRHLEQLNQLCNSQSGAKINTRSDAYRRLANTYGLDAATLTKKVLTTLKTTAQLLELLNPIFKQGST